MRWMKTILFLGDGVLVICNWWWVTGCWWWVSGYGLLVMGDGLSIGGKNNALKGQHNIAKGRASLRAPPFAKRKRNTSAGYGKGLFRLRKQLRRVLACWTCWNDGWQKQKFRKKPWKLCQQIWLLFHWLSMTAINTGFLYNEISSRICRIEPVFFLFLHIVYYARAQVARHRKRTVKQDRNESNKDWFPWLNLAACRQMS